MLFLKLKKQNLFDNEWTHPLGIALLIHILFFSSFTFHVNDLLKEPGAEIAFLGSLLESFETRKLQATTSMSPEISSILSSKDDKIGRAAFTPYKPNLTRQVDINSKLFSKSLPSEKVNLEGTPIAIPPNPQNEPLTPIYQKLRLYQ